MEQASRTKVLVIDDAERVRESIELSFSRDDLDLHFALNGAEGLKMVERISPTIIILDLKMPKMNGLEVLSRLEDYDIDPRRIIVLSGHGDNKDIRECFKAGVTTYIAKPFNNHILRGTVKNLIDLLDYKRNLEEKVEQRTRELQASLDQVHQLSVEKNQFLRFLSHEMRTPLNWISGSQAFFSQKKMTPGDQEFVELIQMGFKQLMQLNDSFMSYIEFVEEKLELSRDYIDLYPTIKEILEDRSEMLERKQIKYELELDSNFQIYADYGYLKRLVKILIDNGIAFSKTGGILAIRGSGQAETFRLEFSDQGTGIRQENLDRIFKPFAIDSFERKEDGYGLNLPKAKIICDAHGWKIWAESDGPGQGSTFIVASGD